MSACSFSAPGTYGHECGAQAVLVGTRPSDLTRSGVFYVKRCVRCSKIEGGENVGVANWEPYNQEQHVNQWK